MWGLVGVGMGCLVRVVDEKVVSYGKVLKQEEVASILWRERGL